MEFIDFLKYGAIGISLALAILSYRLLSKEQAKTEPRDSILRSIGYYMALTLVLSLLFGISEILTKQSSEENTTAKAEIESIWSNHCSEYPQDTTLALKVRRIAQSMNQKSAAADTAGICGALVRELDAYREELDCFKEGFYPNVIKLQNAVRNDPDGWVNIDFQTENKAEVVQALKKILRSLDIGVDFGNATDGDIVDHWKLLKGQWSKKKLTYIFNSDISELVKKYLQVQAEQG